MIGPRTETGRRIVDNIEYVLRHPDDLGLTDIPQAVRRLEDEAARKERERIVATIEVLAYMTPDDRAAVLAAITDTGEEAAP